MSSFRVQGYPSEIEVQISGYALSRFKHAHPDSTPDQILQKFQDFRAFKNWLSRVTDALSLQTSPTHPHHAHPYELRGIEVETVTMFGKRGIGFMKIDANVGRDDKIGPGGKVLAKGKMLPGSVFLRGGSCAIMLVLEPFERKNGKEVDLPKHVVLAVQPRPAVGSLRFVELPAGMVDEQEVRSAMLNEIDEEIGWEEKIGMDDLIDLFEEASGKSTSDPSDMNSNPDSLDDAMYPSVGACDESIKLYLYEHRLEREKFERLKESLHLKKTGAKDSSEDITLEVVPLKDLWKVGARDGKILGALALYLKYKGLVPDL